MDLGNAGILPQHYTVSQPGTPRLETHENLDPHKEQCTT